MKLSVVVLALLMTGSASAEQIGRLFYTPEQRVILDSARRQKIKVEEQSEEQAPEIVTLNGVVKRDDGRTTVWLNSRPVNDQQHSSGVLVRSHGAASDPVTLSLPQGGRSINLRVGQNLDVTTGQVIEPYNPRAAEMKQAMQKPPEAAKPVDSSKSHAAPTTAKAEEVRESVQLNAATSPSAPLPSAAAVIIPSPSSTQAPARPPVP